MLLGFALVLLSGFVFGELFGKLRLPKLTGMIAAGIALGSLGLLDEKLLGISAELRKIALVIILLRAGMNLKLSVLKKIGRPAALLCFVPACFEMAGTVLLAPPLLGLSITEAAVMGAVLAAVSPAVIVPKMLKLMEERRGTDKLIPQMILAGVRNRDVLGFFGDRTGRRAVSTYAAEHSAVACSRRGGGSGCGAAARAPFQENPHTRQRKGYRRA